VIYLVMGGQAGSEGKGEFVAYLATKLYSSGTLGAVVRTGGPNAGHTMTYNQIPYKMRQIPCAWHLPDVPLFIGPGSLIDYKVLTNELAQTSILLEDRPPRLVPRLVIDRSAIIIQDSDKIEEQKSTMMSSISSTKEGIGSARANHTRRSAQLAQHLTNPNFKVGSVSDELNSIYDSGKDIIIESTQGFDLSLTHSGHYPYTTSRDVTPGQILNDAGLSSRLDHQVIAVVRTFPIRVAGTSGPMAHETTWGSIGQPEEYTTVTGRVRRVGEFDPDQIRRMVKVCRPDFVCLTFLDYLHPFLKNSTNEDDIREFAGKTLDSLEEVCDIDIKWVSTGPGIITPQLATRCRVGAAL